MKKTFQTTVEIDGIGNSKEQAINKALGKIQQKVMSSYKGLILGLNPRISELSKQKKQRTPSAFYFSFSQGKEPHTRLSWKLMLTFFCWKQIKFNLKKLSSPKRSKR